MHTNIPARYIPASPARFGAILEDFLAGRNPRTLRAYRADLAALAEHLGVMSADEAARRMLGSTPGEGNAAALGWRAAMQSAGLAAATINRRLAALRSLARVARILGLITWEIAVPGVKSRAYRDTRGPGLSGVRALLGACGGSSRADIRNRAIIRLLFDLALRRAEVAELDLEHLDMGAGTLSILGKGRTERERLDLPAPTVEALAAWLRLRGTAPGALFVNFDRAGKGERLTPTSIYRIIRALGAGVGLQVRPHGLRHAAITAAVEGAASLGVDLTEVRDFSRHANISTLIIYRDRARNVQGRLAGLVSGTI